MILCLKRRFILIQKTKMLLLMNLEIQMIKTFKTLKISIKRTILKKLREDFLILLHLLKCFLNILILILIKFLSY